MHGYGGLSVRFILNVYSVLSGGEVDGLGFGTSDSGGCNVYR